MTASNAISSRTAPSGAKPRNAAASSSSTGDRFSLDGASFAVDPRIHAFRSDIADISLAGRIIAPHYARPLTRACGIREALLWPDPLAEGEPVSELLPGEAFAVLEYSGGWAWGYSAADHVVGYVEAIALAEPFEATHIVCEASAPIHPEGSISSPILARLPMAARLIGHERGPCLATDAGCVPLCHLRRIGEHEDDPAAVAERLAGTPSRPGGRTWRGLDCAALVQLAFGLCGVPLPRETDQQKALGEPVREDEPLERGDLLFSGNHVA
ncbi:NlpC/P60 family protein, partial [Allosphingosinicella sp.]|uniref:C40 family peptidase n=1 Tax=Allosphingosinicella sp. TaxID=2823234 RepID=UPI002EF9BF2A